jgi:hypothetical protein
MNLGMAISYPLRDRHWLRKVCTSVAAGMVLGGLGTASVYCSGYGKLASLAFGPVTLLAMIGMFVVGLLTQGYCVRSLRMQTQDQTGLPEWNGFGQLLKFGAGMWVTGLVLWTLPLWLMWFGLHTIFSSMFSSSHMLQGMASAAVTFAGMGTGMIIGGLGFLAVAGVFFLTPMVWLRFSQTLNPLKALNLMAVVRDIRKGMGDYTFAVVFFALMHVGASAILNFVPLLGGSIYACISVYLSLALGNMMNQYGLTHLKD